MSADWSGSARAVNVTLVRRGAVVLAVAAVLVVLACGAAHGRDGALGALLGVLFAVAFFGVDLAVYLRPPGGVLRSATVVVLLYVAKLACFALVVLALAALVTFDHRSFVLAVVVEAIVATVIAVGVVTRMRVPYVQP